MSTRRQFLVQTTAVSLAAASSIALSAEKRERCTVKAQNCPPPSQQPRHASNSHTATQMWNLRIKVRDGTDIAVDILLPPGPGPFPFVVTRTPYGRSRSVARLLPYLERGYGLGLVDMRGRGDSDGEWRPFVKDVDDAYDVIEWIGTQPWCTGKIGMVGGSYDGLTQWWTAAGRPPHLSCIVPQAVGSFRDSDVPFEGTGIPTQYWLWWMTLVTGRTFQNGGAPAWEDQMPTLPLRTLDERLGTTSSAWQSYVAGKIDYLSPDFALSEAQMAGIDIPVLVGVGWWDDQTTMIAWRALQKSKRAKDCRLLVGAWDHAGNAAPRPVLGGMDVSASVLDMPAYIESFLAVHLKGETNAMSRAKRCHIFQTGTQRWDDLDEWPHPGAKETPLYLASKGDARSLRGNGRLSLQQPHGGADSDKFVFDPNNPGRDMTNMAMFAWSDPPLDNRFMLRRKDVLVYDTEPMSKPMAIGGRTRHRLFVSSDRVDTDLFISICDVHPDGRSVALGGDCGLRLSYRDGTPQPKLLKPGEIVEVHLEGHWLHHVVLPGHRLRVAISSTKYPFSARNGGNGKFWADDTVLLPQTNTIYHTAKHRSQVLLPVVAMEVA